MSIIRKKLSAKRELPDFIKNSLTLWAPLHNAFCDRLGELTQSSWEVVLSDIKIDALPELISALPEQGLYFGYGDKECGVSFITYYDAGFAEKVTRSALEMKKGPVDDNYKIGKLDLLLFKPVTEKFNIELGTLFENTYEDFSTSASALFEEVERGLTTEDINNVADDIIWNEVTLSVQPVQKEPDKTQNAEVPTPALAVRVLLPQTLLLKLVSTHASEIDAPVIDSKNPWTRHMRNSLDTAIVPVRAVVETCRMTVADCTRFEIGQIIDLPGVSLDSIGVEADMSGVSVNFATAKLGIYKAHRAVKLIENMDPEFCSDSIAI